MINIAIVEDEIKVQNLLKEYIHQYELENKEKFEVSIFSDGDKIAYEYQAKYDIIFLDIQMKRMNGMDAAKMIRTMDVDVIIIFITNMASFAIQGYSVDAMDFVLKPVPYFAFSEQLKKAVTRLKKRSKFYLAVPFEEGIVRLDVSNISHIESYGHRLILYTNEQQYTITDTMKNMEEKLLSHHFFRCNNCYLVNLSLVESVQQNTVIVAGIPLQVSRPKKKAFMDALADYIGGIAK